MRPVWLFTAGLAFVLLCVQFALRTQPNSNEAWFADAARNLWLHGSLGTTILASKGTWLQGIDRHTYWSMPFHLILQSLWYSLFGFGLFQLRTLSIAAGLGTILAWYLVAGRLMKSWSFALVFVLLLAIDLRLITYSSNGRMDSLCAFCGTAGLASYLMLRGRSQPIAVLIAHSAVALSGLTHPCGIIYAFDLLLLQWWFGGFRRIRETWLWSLFPYLVFGTAFGLWALQDWPSFSRQFGGNVSGLAGEYKGAGRFSSLSQSWFGLEAELQSRYLKSAKGWAAQWTLCLYGAGLVWLVTRSGLRSNRRVRLMFVMGVAHFIFFWLFEGLKLSNYLLHLLPLLICLAMVAGRDIFEAKRIWIAIALACLLILDALAMRQNLTDSVGNKNYEPIIPILQQRRGMVVTAPSEFAFEIGFDGKLQDDHRLGFYTGRSPDLFITNSWQRQWLEQAKKSEPQLASWIQQKLDNRYREIYRNEAFVVWRKIP